jgi:alpha-glucuronidase
MTIADVSPCWLRYERMEDEGARASLAPHCRTLSVLGRGPEVDSAVAELARGLRGMLDLVPKVIRGPSSSATLILATTEAARGVRPALPAGDPDPGHDGFLLDTASIGSHRSIVVRGGSPAGVLHGVFRLLLLMAAGDVLDRLPVREKPSNPLRMICHWDNLDGSVERGYAGRSIFFRDGRVIRDLSRVRDYARLLASIGINAVTINNVNVHDAESRLSGQPHLPEVARLADLFRAWGIRLFLSVSFAAPVTEGGLPTADPLDQGVRAWWRKRAQAIYRRIPDFGGFMVKADSEGRPGPFSYGRSHADGANMFAEALAPHGGVVLWRCFVYNSRQDWRDRSTDRARAAYDTFVPLDGQFADNVLLSIKNGPMDFQVREPVSPLFGGLERTNQALELQITQEYTGQQRHLCCLVPQWKEYLDFDTHARPGATLARVASGEVFGRPMGGVVGVSNAGDDANWTGHELAQANLYGFGRLAWDPGLPARVILGEWTRLTWGRDPAVRSAIEDMLAASWGIYESYTAPLGAGWMVNPGHHYGPNVDGYEYSRWGTYHHADSRGIGVDRTAATGTGFTAQYRPENAARYESREACPDELLLFFHHVPYSHLLRSRKTVIQHIYDSHFEGVEKAAGLLETWRSLQGRIDGERWRRVLERLEEQKAHADEWRDVVNAYFHRKSGVEDLRSRVVY